jgi:hypothetical protein
VVVQALNHISGTYDCFLFLRNEGSMALKIVPSGRLRMKRKWIIREFMTLGDIYSKLQNIIHALYTNFANAHHRNSFPSNKA